MTMNFHDPKNRNAYTTRQADEGWLQLIEEQGSLLGKKAADIGCGGGIYTKAMLRLGASEVIGIDFSQAMLEGAEAHCSQQANCRFLQGNALNIPLADRTVDVVLERALVHHLSLDELAAASREAYRILQASGVLIIQDRTPEDCLIPGSREHLRGYFFEVFPKLIDKETGRRHSSKTVAAALKQAGFHRVQQLQLWETRERYTQFINCRNELLNRTGRSILHELTDEELQLLVDTIQQEAGYRDDDPVVEKDRWTLWFAYKDDRNH